MEISGLTLSVGRRILSVLKNDIVATDHMTDRDHLLELVAERSDFIIEPAVHTKF